MMPVPVILITSLLVIFSFFFVLTVKWSISAFTETERESTQIHRHIKYTCEKSKGNWGVGETHTYTHANIKRSFSTVSFIVCSRQISKYQHQHSFQIVEKGPCTTLYWKHPKWMPMRMTERSREGDRSPEGEMGIDENMFFFPETFLFSIHICILFYFILFFVLNKITKQSVWQKKVNKM